MDTLTRQPPLTAGGDRALALLLPIVVGGAVGALTAYAQGWLGDGLSSLANSAGPWSLAAFAVARRRRLLVSGATAAAVTLWCCELGYALATIVRGGSNATSTVLFWLAAGLLAGPALGVAAVWSRRGGVLSAIGFAVLAGVFVGEAAYGWSSVADTTDWRYWAVELVVGLALAVYAGARELSARHVAAAAGTTTIVAAVVLAAARLV